jgi:hypothetical protein
MPKLARLSRLHAAAFAVAAIVAVCGDGRARAAPTVHKVGEVTWHAKSFIGKDVTVVGYVLAVEKDYVLVSDERTGKISAHDLPVTGAGIDQLQPAMKYVLEGKLLDRGLRASNGSPYHLDLTAPPQAAK